MPVVDANVLVALHVADHEHHTKARRDASEGHLVATNGAVLEMSQALRRYWKEKGQDANRLARESVAELANLPGFRTAPDVPLATISLLYAAEPGLSFADAWCLAAAVQMQEPLLTYDKKLQAAYKRRMRS